MRTRYRRYAACRGSICALFLLGALLWGCGLSALPAKGGGSDAPQVDTRLWMPESEASPGITGFIDTLWTESGAAAVWEGSLPWEAPPPHTAGPLSREEADRLTAELCTLTNRAREQAGLPPLSRTEELDQAATLRAEEASRLFSNTRPDGTAFSTVLGAEGAAICGETLAGGCATPADTAAHWLHAPGQRDNLLHGPFTETGLGVWRTDDGDWYWVQLFRRA